MSDAGGVHMASPFPGMDPYLEQFWRDIHARLVIYAADQLQTHLPGDLRARVEERVFVEPAFGVARSVYPDIRVVERGQGRVPMFTAERYPAVAEPLVIYVSDEPVTERFIEIIDVGSGRRVVSVIEVLSVSNKSPGEGQELYRRKQGELRAGQVNLVEIDLLRAGDRLLSVGASRIPASHRTPYQVCVYRAAADPPRWEVYRVPLRERLPVLSIPLRSTDLDIPLDLQALIDQCYRNGGYDEDIDYHVTPDPPFDAEDALWADALLRDSGRRISSQDAEGR
jgi:hypothetical protein